MCLRLNIGIVSLLAYGIVAIPLAMRAGLPGVAFANGVCLVLLPAGLLTLRIGDVGVAVSMTLVC